MVQTKFESDVVITKGDYTEEKEFVHDLMVNENYRPLTHKSIRPWKLSIAKANAMDDELASKVKTYQAGLKKNKVLDANIGRRSFDFLSTLLAIFTFGISFPIYLVWSLLIVGVKAFVEAKFKGIVFRDSVKIGFGMIAGMLLTIGVFVTLSFWFSGVLLFLVGVLGVYGAICWFRVKESLPYLINELRWYSLPDNMRQDLANQRASIVADLV